jgi:hypothetical protein
MAMKSWNQRLIVDNKEFKIDPFTSQRYGIFSNYGATVEKKKLVN